MTHSWQKAARSHHVSGGGPMALKSGPTYLIILGVTGSAWAYAYAQRASLPPAFQEIVPLVRSVIRNNVFPQQQCSR